MLKIPILICLFLIGGDHQVSDQYGPTTGKARAFRNGVTLDGRPKNEGVMAYFVKFQLADFRQFEWYQVICMNSPEGFLPKKTKFHDTGGPGTVVPPRVNLLQKLHPGTIVGSHLHLIT